MDGLVGWKSLTGEKYRAPDKCSTAEIFKHFQPLILEGVEECRGWRVCVIMEGKQGEMVYQAIHRRGGHSTVLRCTILWFTQEGRSLYSTVLPVVYFTASTCILYSTVLHCTILEVFYGLLWFINYQAINRHSTSGTCILYCA